MCSKEGRRIILWMCWVVNMLITSVYYTLSFATTHNLVRSYELLFDGASAASNEIWRAPIAAAALGGALVLAFNVLSCAILAKKSVARDGPGLAYGFVAAMCASLAFFALLCGLVLDGFRDVVRSELQVKLRDTWTELSSGVYVATIAFAYLCFVMLLLFFVALVAFQSAVTAELGLPPAPPGVVNVVPAAALRNPFAAAHHAKYHDPAAHSPFGGGAVSPPPGYEGAARIAAFRPGAGGSGGGSPMAATASAMPPPQVAMMAMPTPMVGSPLAMNQDSAL